MTTPDEPRHPAQINLDNAQTGDVTIGDVAGGDIHKPVLAAGGIYAPGGTVVQAFVPRSVGAGDEELARAQARLADLPLDAIPAPEDTLPPGSWLGQLSRNHQFVGREEDLRALAALLKGGQAVAVSQARSAVASGLGGIGKTQLAIEFAYRYGRYFAGVFWLNFAQPDSILTEFTRLGGAAHLQLFVESSGLSFEDQIRFVRARLACGLPYLLIFDNCEQPDLARQHHPGGAARVLITSRSPAWPEELGVRRHPLGSLRREESVALLRNHRRDLSDADADALARELGDLPLALHLAGRFLAGPGKILSTAQYLAELRSPQIFARLPLRERDGKLPTGHDRDVARTFALSYERLDRQDDEDAVGLRLLARAAHLAPGEVIAADLLRATLEAGNDLDARLAGEAGLERLIGLGLIERTGEAGLRMHRLVGAYVRRVSDDHSAQAAVERAVAAAARELTDTPALVPLAAFLPILRGVTDAALPRKDAQTATLCIWLGWHLNRLGSYATAQPYLEQALAVRERVLGAEHPDTAQSLNNLAALYDAQGNYAAAGPLYQRALAINERVLGAAHPDTATSLNNLAALYDAQGDYAAAGPLYQRALAINERVLGAEHPVTATSLNNLAALYENQGNYAAAGPLYQRVLALREQVLGADHPQTATSLNNLAGLLKRQGNYAAAGPLYQRALAINERVLGAAHPDTAQSLNNLAEFFRVQGNYAVAGPLYQRALAICERVLGAEHPTTAQSLNNLAVLYHAQGNYAAAGPLYQRALAICERVLGAEHPQTATSLNNLAVLYAYQNNFAAALPLIERALAIQQRVLGPTHPDTVQTAQSLAHMRQVVGQGQAAASDPSEQLAALLAAIARIAQGDGAQRGVVEEALTKLEGQGWMLRGPVARIWAGERDGEVLSEGLDALDAALVRRILKLIASAERMA